MHYYYYYYYYYYNTTKYHYYCYHCYSYYCYYCYNFIFRRVSLKSTLMLADQMLLRIEYFHSKDRRSVLNNKQ